MALTVEDVYEYVGIEAEYADETQEKRAMRALSAARTWIIGAVGKRVDLDNPYEWLEWPLAQETMLMAAGEYYELRTLTDVNLNKYAGKKAASSINRLAFDSLEQLKYCDYSDFPFDEEPPSEPDEPVDPPDVEQPIDPPDVEDGGDGEWQSETQ